MNSVGTAQHLHGIHSAWVSVGREQDLAVDFITNTNSSTLPPLCSNFLGDKFVPLGGKLMKTPDVQRGGETFHFDGGRDRSEGGMWGRS